jgi:regulator of sigma D
LILMQELEMKLKRVERKVTSFYCTVFWLRPICIKESLSNQKTLSYFCDASFEINYLIGGQFTLISAGDHTLPRFIITFY